MDQTWYIIKCSNFISTCMISQKNAKKNYHSGISGVDKFGTHVPLTEILPVGNINDVGGG